jgi:methyltransferase (TIGR00027 family)
MIEGRPSRTALFIASIVLVMGKTGCDLLPPGIVPLQKAVLATLPLSWLDHFFLFVLCDNAIFCHFLVWFASTFIVHNGMQAVAFRKSYMEQQVREFLAAHSGKAQVLVLAAGYDTLALRVVDNYPETIFWEIDHPATGNFKDRLWNDHAEQKNNPSDIKVFKNKPRNLFHGHVDLVEQGSLTKTLKASSSYNTSAPTVVIMEGLLSYLSTQQIHTLFDEVGQIVGPNSVVAFNVVAVHKSGKSLDFGWLSSFASRWVSQQGEPYLLGMNPEKIPEFFKGTKWTLHSGGVKSYGRIRVTTVELRS